MTETDGVCFCQKVDSEQRTGLLQKETWSIRTHGIHDEIDDRYQLQHNCSELNKWADKNYFSNNSR